MSFKQNTDGKIKMHTLQPKHTKMSKKDIEELLNKLNISKAQLPKIFLSDFAIPEGCEIGDILKIERKGEEGPVIYYRVIV